MREAIATAAATTSASARTTAAPTVIDHIDGSDLLSTSLGQFIVVVIIVIEKLDEIVHILGRGLSQNGLWNLWTVWELHAE